MRGELGDAIALLAMSVGRMNDELCTIAGLATYTLSNNTRHASACKRTPAGFLLPMKFTKPAIPLDDQIALLRSRGLTIADEERARHYLRFVGYYRLAGYALPYQVNYNADGSHRFLGA